MANKRREKGAGSIRKVGVKYYGRLMINGTTKNFTGSSAADVRRQMKAYDPEREEAERRNPLLTEYITSWLLTFKKPSLRPSSYDRIECTVSYQILPYYKGVRLSDLTPEIISQWMQRLQQEGLSYSTIKKAYVALNAALDQAVLSGLLSRNPMIGLSMISSEQFDTPDIRYLSKAEMQLFCSEITTKPPNNKANRAKCSYLTNYHWYGPALLLDLHTGLRGGELAALQITDYDATTHMLHVRTTAQRSRKRDKHGVLVTGSSIRCSSPKTRAGVRSVPCDAVARDAIQELLQRAGEAKSRYLIVTSAGTPTTCDALEKAALRVYRRIGVQGATLHSLRHTFASQLFAAGVDILTISRTLGHASTAITMSIYVHHTAESQEAAAAKIEAALSISNILQE